MVVELISVGTEILLGNIVNTNAAYLAEKCALVVLYITRLLSVTMKSVWKKQSTRQ
mgnify:CR=1 FL=1